jgi:hypothetical protein
MVAVSVHWVNKDDFECGLLCVLLHVLSAPFSIHFTYTQLRTYHYESTPCVCHTHTGRNICSLIILSIYVKQ